MKRVGKSCLLSPLSILITGFHPLVRLYTMNLRRFCSRISFEKKQLTLGDLLLLIGHVPGNFTRTEIDFPSLTGQAGTVFASNHFLPAKFPLSHASSFFLYLDDNDSSKAVFLNKRSFVCRTNNEIIDCSWKRWVPIFIQVKSLNPFKRLKGYFSSHFHKSKYFWMYNDKYLFLILQCVICLTIKSIIVFY